MDVLKSILTSGLTWLVTSLVLPAIVIFSKRFRIWLSAQTPRAIATLSALVAISTATFAIAVFWFFAPLGISITPTRFGNNEARPGQEEGFFTAQNAGTAREIKSRDEFPVCMITTMEIAQVPPTASEAALCELLESQNKTWTITVRGTARCKVTCLKIQLLR